MAQPASSILRIAAVSAIALVGACSSHGQMQQQAQTNSPPQTRYAFMMSRTTAGQVVSSTDGMTLYTYDKDAPGQSNCNGECAQYWRPYLAAPDSKPFGHMTLVVRTDGKKQWAYENKPLYTFVQDTVPGEIKGNDFHNTWHVVPVTA